MVDISQSSNVNNHKLRPTKRKMKQKNLQRLVELLLKKLFQH